MTEFWIRIYIYWKVNVLSYRERRKKCTSIFNCISTSKFDTALRWSVIKVKCEGLHKWWCSKKFTNTSISIVYWKTDGPQVSYFVLLFLKSMWSNHSFIITWLKWVHRHFQKITEDVFRAIYIKMWIWYWEYLFNVTAGVLLNRMSSNLEIKLTDLNFSKIFFAGLTYVGGDCVSIIFGESLSPIKAGGKVCWMYERGGKFVIKVKRVWKDSSL